MRHLAHRLMDIARGRGLEFADVRLRRSAGTALFVQDERVEQASSGLAAGEESQLQHAISSAFLGGVGNVVYCIVEVDYGNVIEESNEGPSADNYRPPAPSSSSRTRLLSAMRRAGSVE